jgi:hypothetical protein
MDYIADKFCSALLAFLKVESLLMLRKRHPVDQTATYPGGRVRRPDDKVSKTIHGNLQYIKILTLKGTPTEA